MVELVERDRRHGLGFVEIEFDLLFRAERMDHVGNTADKVDGIEHIDRLRTVGHGDGDLVALAHADGLERLGAVFDLAHQRAVGRGLAHKVERDRVRVLPGDIFHRLEHGAVKILQMHGHIAQIILPRGLYRYAVRSMIRHVIHSLPPRKAVFPKVPGASQGT